ncbi:MAG: hypothetical protein QGI78_01550 [Phycisphaerales bacterium]|jgi:Tfp pilus assembly PilM family ATPase|nr:hypothetical protein [Phycisphaerales bacterium]
MSYRSQRIFGTTDHPIAMHFGNDEVIRLMQTKGIDTLSLRAAFEVSSKDGAGLREAIQNFRSREVVICTSSSALLVSHIRTDCNATEEEVTHLLCERNSRWNNCSIRQLPLFTNIQHGSQSKAQQEILCVGVEHAVIQECTEIAEAAKLKVRRITVPVHATLRAFDRLYRREGDEAMTSMLVDFDEKQAVAMIAHGMNLVVARSMQCTLEMQPAKKWSTSPALIPACAEQNEFERRNCSTPRGMCETQDHRNNNATTSQHSFVSELQRCMRHHSSLFPDRAIDRVVFSGTGALQTETCSSVATDLELQGFISDPSAWIEGADELAGGPVWTTAAGLCLAHSRQVP